MSLMASAHNMRMKKKREKVATSPSSGNAKTSVVSPLNNAGGKEDVPSGTGNGRAGGGNNSAPPNSKASSSSSPYDAISPTNHSLSPTNHALSPTNAPSPVIATLNGVKKPSRYHRAPGVDPPSMQAQHRGSHATPADLPPAQQQQQQHSQAFHPPRPPVHGGRRPYVGGGINSLDTSGDHMVDHNSNTHPQWQQHHHHQQHQQQQRGPSPSPSPEYRQNTLRHPSPQRLPHHSQLQQPPLNPPPQSPGTFDAATRYQGNYTNYLSPRKPRRVPSRPRRRYDSFTEAPEDAEEEEILFQQQQQQQQHQQQQQQHQQHQAFDPFAPSPLTVGGQSILGNPVDLHSAHRASPLFQAAFPRQQHSGSESFGSAGPGGGGSSMGPSLAGTAPFGAGGGGYTPDYGGSPRGNPISPRDHPATTSPRDSADGNDPPPHPPSALATIDGNRRGTGDGFVYPDGSSERDHRDSRSEEYREDEGEAVSAKRNRFFDDEAGDNDAVDLAASYPPSPAAVEPGFRQEPPPLMDNYDFEYHTEKDEGSTFELDGGGDEEGMMGYDDRYAEEGRDVAMPLPPSMEVDGEDGMEGNDLNSANMSTNAVDPHSNLDPNRIRGDRRSEPDPRDVSTNGTSCENQTVDSERALSGTPAKKKRDHASKKKRRGHRSRIVIDNVGEASEPTAAAATEERFVRSNTDSAVGGGIVGNVGLGSGRNPRYAIHYLEEENNSLLASEDNDGIHQSGLHHHHDDGDERRHHDGASPHLGGSHLGIASKARRDIAAHARRIASGSESADSRVSDEMMPLGPGDEPGRLPPRLPSSGENLFHPENSGWNEDGAENGAGVQFFGPPRISMSRSWDSQVDAAAGGNNKQAAAAGGGGAPSSSFGSFSRNLMWDNENDGNDNDQNSDGNQQQGRAVRASKSWDEDNNGEVKYPAVADESVTSWGTWGDNTASLFGGLDGAGTNSGDAAGGGNKEDPFGSDKENFFQQQQQQKQQENNIFHQQDDEIDARALAEWDKAEAEWREKSVVEDVSVEAKEDQDLLSSFLNTSIQSDEAKPVRKKPPPLLSPPKTKGHHPWKSLTSPRTTNNNKGFGKFNLPEEVIPTDSGVGVDGFSELTGVGGREPVRFSEKIKLPPEEDDDSIFEFDKRGGGSLLSGMSGARKQVESAAPMQSPSSPADIFSKINSSLEMATKTKNRALGIDSDESNDRSEVEEDEELQRVRDEAALAKVQDSPASQASGDAGGSILSTGSGRGRGRSGKRIAFAAGAPQVHTYLAPEESSESDREYTYDGTEEDDEDTLIDTNDDDGAMEAEAKSNLSRQSQQQQTQLPLKGFRRMDSPASGTVEDNSLLREQEGSDNDTYGDSTVGDSTYNDPNKGGERNDRGGGAGVAGGGGGNDNWALMDHVDNAVTLVATSLGGLFGVASPTAASAAASLKSDNEKGENASRRTADRAADRSRGSGGDRASSSRSLATEDEEKSVETDLDNDTYGESTVQSTQYTRGTESSEYDWLGYMRNIIFPKDTDGASVISGRDTLGSAKYSGTYDCDESTYAGQDDEDSYLLQQALAAARAIHHVQGVEYDEAQEINVLTDIKFVVVTVSLPLGLLFQEHEIGVWVSRVVPDGNGAQKGVQHGDQLAAINGNSSVHTTIDEVASTISGTPENMGVELTFLRYVGPLRAVPGSIIQEGFEVTDTSVSPKKMMEEEKPVVKSKRSLFPKRKSSKQVNNGGGGRSTPPSSPGAAATGNSTRRFATLDISPRRSSAAALAKPAAVATHSPPKGSSGSSSKQGTSASAPSMPSTGGGQPPRQPAKRKKSLGKLMSFKKK